jgi:hypothetical protein
MPNLRWNVLFYIGTSKSLRQVQLTQVPLLHALSPSSSELSRRERAHEAGKAGRRFVKGKFCSTAERPVNKKLGVLQMSSLKWSDEAPALLFEGTRIRRRAVPCTCLKGLVANPLTL